MEQAVEEPAADMGAEEPAADAAAEAPVAGAEEPAPEEEIVTQSDNPDERNKKDDLPFDPDDEPMGDKDEYGNTIKHKARHLAKKGMRQAMDVKELAEFITSFYDKESGTFPKGPEGVCTMVGKKFGEQAETVARKFVERMAPQQTTDNNPELKELSRMRELAGVSEGPMWDKIKAFGKSAGDKVMRHADITGYTKAKQNFEKWIDSHPELESEKENLLAKFDTEAEEDPHTPWDWGKNALASWKKDRKSRETDRTETLTQEAAGNYMWQEVGDEADQRQLSKMADRLAKMYKRNAESSASDEEIMSVLDDVVREFVPQVGKLNNVVPVAQAFFDKLPIKEPEPEYDDDGEEMEPESDVRGDFIRDIWSMVKITAAAEKGDTSSYGYKVHPNLNKESAELEAIKRLSGIAKGIGF